MYQNLRLLLTTNTIKINFFHYFIYYLKNIIMDRLMKD